MEVDCLSYAQTGYFSELICDYLDENEGVRPFYNNYPSLANFEAQIQEKQQSFPDANRTVLCERLKYQYADIKASKKTRANLGQLKETNTFTVVTGHQLNLFTGPLYFLYKIISTIKLTEQLKKRYPKYDFVPIYWMATEDHDFEEINFFNFKGQKLHWNIETSGAVGVLSTDGLQEVYEVFCNVLGGGKNAETLKDLFRKSYLEHDTLTQATRFLANELFGEYGLVIIDGDDAQLKTLAIPHIKKDIFENIGHKTVTETIDLLQKSSNAYGVQVNPREINYFYITKGIRKRIIEENGDYQVNETDIRFSKNELCDEIEKHPQRFSPNVVSRPLYQEVILPNLCYIGGGGEIAYWLELKAMFDKMQVPFPVVLLRNSALVVSKKQQGKIAKLNLTTQELFIAQNNLINKKIREISNIDIDFAPQKELLEKQFADLLDIADQTDKSFLGAVKAQEAKQKKGLDKLEKRLLKAQKRKLKDHVQRLTALQNALFPNGSLQERVLNFSELYLEWGEDLIPHLMQSLKPLDLQFTILEQK